MVDQGLKLNVGANVDAAVAGLNKTSDALKKVGATAQTTEQQLNAIADKIGKSNPVSAANFSKASESIKDLGKSAASAAPEIEGAAEAVEGFGSISAGLATVGVSALGIVIASIVKDIRNYANELSFAHDQQVLLNTAIGEAQSKTAGELAELRSLVSIAQDETLSRDARTEALKKLNKEYPAYFTNATLDGQTSEKLKEVTDKLTQSILLNAKAKAIQSEIDKSAARVAAAQNDESTDLLTTYDKLKVGLTAIFGGDAAARIKLATLATKDYNEVVTRETANQEKLAKELNDTNKVLANQGTLFDDVDKKVKSKKEKLEKEKILIPVELRLPESEADLVARGLKTIDFTKLFTKGLRDTPTIEFSVDTKKAIEALNDLREHLEIVKKATADFKDKVSSALSGLAADSIAQVGAAIGDLISGDGIQGAVNGLLTILGNGLITIGKYVIEYAITIGAIKKAIDVLLKAPGGVAIAIGLGIAAIALGTILKNKVSNATKFADGGVVYGPTQALIGEAGPEVVFPLNKINQFLKGASSGGAVAVSLEPVQSVVRGGDIYQTFKLAEARRGRGIR